MMKHQLTWAAVLLYLLGLSVSISYSAASPPGTYTCPLDLSKYDNTPSKRHGFTFYWHGFYDSGDAAISARNASMPPGMRSDVATHDSTYDIKVARWYTNDILIYHNWIFKGPGGECSKIYDDNYQGQKRCDLQANQCQQLVSDPINIFSGNNYEAETDVQFASPYDRKFSFSRFYNSQSNRAEDLGNGWTHSYSIRLKPNYSGDTNRLKVIDETGAGYYFKSIAANNVFKELTSIAAVSINNSNEYAWKRNGLTYSFNITTYYCPK